MGHYTERHIEWLRRVLVVFCLIVGCGDDDAAQPAGVANSLNPCATQGATYRMDATERYGDCGAMGPRFVIATDDTIAATCDSVRISGCTVVANHCRAVDALNCMVDESYVTTFSPDGAAASSSYALVVECESGSACSSTYDVVFTRL